MLPTVRGRITLLATVIVLLLLTGTGVALIGAQRAVLTDSVDEVLQRQSAEIARDVTAGRLGSGIVARGDEEAFALVVDAAGEVIASTGPSFDLSNLAVADDGSPRYANIRSPGEATEYRVRTERVGGVTIRAATPLDDVEDSVAALTGGLMVAVPAASALLAGLVWVLVGSVLRPVEDIRKQVDTITARHLERRVPEPRSRDEIARLAHTMNDMLARLESASERQRRFVADASHELRTPLTRIRAEIELELTHPNPAGHEHALRSVLEDADALQRLIEDLLTLARSDDDALSVRQDPVDLDDIVLREVRRLRSTSGISVDVGGVSGAQVIGDSAQLGRVVRNLLDNAAQHGGSNVDVTLGEINGDAVLAVTDDGAGIPAHLRDHVFDRFNRIDDARTRDAGGSGLGLAITRDLVVAHGGTVTVDAEHAPGARFVVRLPLVRYPKEQARI